MFMHKVEEKDKVRIPAMYNWNREQWIEEITTHFGDWQLAIENPNYWISIKEYQHDSWRSEHEKIAFSMMLKLNGPKFLGEWISKPEPYNSLASKWIKSCLNEATYTTPDIWRETPEEFWDALPLNYRNTLIEELFDRYPGEPFQLNNKLETEYSIGLRKECIFINIGYITSMQINILLDTAMNAKDIVSFIKIKKMIQDRENACNQHMLLGKNVKDRTSYSPNHGERELIALLLCKMKKSGYKTAPLPEIYLSIEPPPLFIEYPDLDKNISDDSNLSWFRDSDITSPNNNNQQEFTDIESLLGCYISNPKIILFDEGLHWFADKMSIDYKAIRAVVLLHEYAHWVTHLLPKSGIPSWPTHLFDLTEDDVHEGWAQLMTWWVLNDVKGPLLETFEILNKKQSSKYHTFEHFTTYNEKDVIMTLESLRLLPIPSTLSAWQSLLT